MKQRTEIINQLIKDNEYKSYLEIGVDDAKNFHAIECDDKVGVDPVVAAENIFMMESDVFFNANERAYDFVFIDGLHHSDQVERDIVNSYNALNKGGMILIHDCNPPNELCSRVPIESKEWCGDVFRAVCGFINEYGEKIKIGYFDEPYGLFAIYKTGRYKVQEGFNMPELTYKEFDKNWRHKVMCK